MKLSFSAATLMAALAVGVMLGMALLHYGQNLTGVCGR